MDSTHVNDLSTSCSLGDRAVFRPEQRDALRSELIEAARDHSAITGVALTGSASVGKEDRWSDIDLAFGVRDDASLASVLDEFTTRMYGRHAALDHLDVRSGSWIYRVFLLANTLQVDLAFAPEPEFGPLGGTFRLIDGAANPPKDATPTDPHDLIGWAWLYALHARSCIARGKSWQAEYMISGMRDQALALACLRHGQPTRDGRGFDLLPAEVRRGFEGALVGSLHVDELRRAFRGATQCLLEEIGRVDEPLRTRLGPVLEMLAP